MLSKAKKMTKHTASPIALFAGLLMCAQAAYAGPFEDALVSAYKTNPNIKAQIENVNIADEQVAQAVSGWRPSVTGNYSRGRQRNSFAGADFNYSDSITKSVRVSQPIFSGGETIANTKSAKKNVKAAREDLKNTEQNILLQAVTTYMDVVRDESVLELSRSNQQVLQKQLEASKSRFAVGEVTRTDVAQSEARLARASTDLTQAKGALEVSRATFERVIGFKPMKLEKPKNFPTLPTSLDDALKTALLNNPAYNASQQREKAAEYEVYAQKAALLPEVSLTGSMQRQEGAGTRGENDYDSDNVLLNVSVPLYQSGAEYSRVRQAKLNVNQRKMDSINKHDATQEAVTKAWEDLTAQTAAIESNKAGIKAAEVALNGVKQEQLYGSRTVLDVLDAEQELFSARVNLEKTEHDRTVAVFSLLSAVGKLTANDLKLKTEIHDVTEHYNDVKYKMVGF
jgi:outer membrane protein